jgi:branched-chain amino acid transport system permease protein
MMYDRQEVRKMRLTLIGFLAFFLIVPLFLGRYKLDLLTQTLIWSITAMSLDILMGYTGLPSIGHATYLGLGAYSTAILISRYQGTFVGALCLGTMVSAASAAVFGLVALRAISHYFLLITVALAMIVWGLANHWVSFTMGDTGIANIPRPDFGLPWSLTDTLTFYYFTYLFFAIALILMFLIIRSPFGKTLVGIRESESRMRALGYNVWLHKYLVFIITGAFGGFSGVFWTYYTGFVNPTDVDIVNSLEVLLMVALGGSGTLFGAILGAGIIVFLKNLVSVYVERWMMIMGAIFALTAFYAPDGIVGLVRQVLRRGARS